MTSRRPQDPRTKKVRDAEADIPTMGPDVEDPGATVAPDQRDIETYDPGATVMPAEIEAPKPRAVRGGAAATRVAGATVGEEAMTADRLLAARAELRAKAAAAEDAPARSGKGASWALWVIAFLVLGGVGFGVSWFLMNPPGDGEQGAAGEAEDVAVGGATTAAAEDAGAADAAAAAVEEVAAAQVDAAPVEEVAPVAALEEVAVAPLEEVAVAQVDAAPDAAVDEVAAAGADGVAAAADVAVLTVDAVMGGAPELAAIEDVAAVVPPSADVQVVELAPVKLARNPIEATRLNEDGLALRKRGDHDGALKLYEQALVADPEHVWARYNYACELALAGRSKDALNELTTLYKLGTADSRRALAAARKDSDFASIKESGQFFRLTNF